MKPYLSVCAGILSIVLCGCGGDSGIGTPPPVYPPPVADIQAFPTTGAAPLTVNFNASGSMAVAPATITRFEWDFDYQGGIFTTDLDTGLVPTASYDYWGGTYVAAVRVWDSNNKTDVATITLTFTGNQPPAVVLGADKTSGAPPLDVTFTATANDPDGTITLYEWDWNYDGVTFDAEDSGASPIRNHIFPTDGTYTVAVRVTDDYTPPATAIATIVITVTSGPVNQSPVISAWSGTWADSTTPTPQSGAVTYTPANLPNADNIIILNAVTPVTLTAIVTASDPDGDPLTWEWEVGGWGWQGAPIPGETDNTLANYQFTAPGSYYVKVRITDGKGGVARGDLLVLIGFVEAEFYIADAGDNFLTYADPNAPVSSARGYKYIYRCTTADTLYFHDASNLTTDITWDFGDGGTAVNDPAPTHQYTTPGIYHVAYTVNASKPFIYNIAHAIVAVGDATHTVASHLITWDPGQSWAAPSAADPDYSAMLANVALSSPLFNVPTNGCYLQPTCADGGTTRYYTCFHVDIASMGIPANAVVDMAVIAPYVGREQMYGPSADRIKVYEMIGDWGPGDAVTGADFPGGAPPAAPDQNYLVSEAYPLDWGSGDPCGNHENPPYHPYPLNVTSAAQKWIAGTGPNYGVGVTFNDASSGRTSYGWYIWGNTGPSAGWPFTTGGFRWIEPVFVVVYH